MMKFLGRLLGTDTAIENLTDKDNGILVRMGGWANDLHFSEQEKSEANRQVQEWGLRQLTALEPFKIVQRIIAMSTMLVWVLFGINLMVALWYDQLNRCAPSDLACVPPTATDAVIAIVVTPFVAYPIIAVVSLYMSGGVIPGIFSKGKTDQ